MHILYGGYSLDKFDKTAKKEALIYKNELNTVKVKHCLLCFCSFVIIQTEKGPKKVKYGTHRLYRSLVV